MKSHICRIGVGARNASQEEVKVIHICHVKFFVVSRVISALKSLGYKKGNYSI